jgi:PAS domain S-box-containing protein
MVDVIRLMNPRGLGTVEAALEARAARDRVSPGAAGAAGNDLALSMPCLIVVEDDRVAGILTERDIVRLTAQGRSLNQMTVRQAMTQPVITRQDDELPDLFEMLRLFQHHQIRHLPIVDRQARLVGIITQSSLRQICRPIDLLRLRQVSEVMTPQVMWALADTSLQAIAQRMIDQSISCLVLTASADPPLRPVGVLTERDIVQTQALGLDMAQCRVQQVMSTPVITVSRTAAMWTAQQLMAHHRIRRVVVTGDRGELVGIVTQTDILNALNPVELFDLAELLDQEVSQLGAERMDRLEHHAADLEQQVVQQTLAFQSSEARFQAIFENMFQFIGLLSPDGRLLEANQTALIAADAERSQIIGQFFWDTPWWQTPHDTQAQLKQAIAQAAEGNFVRYEVEVVGNQQQLIPIDFSLRPVFNDQGTVIMIIPEGRDLTEAKRLQAEHETALQQLQASQQRYAALVEAAPVGIFYSDAIGRCTFVNDRYCQLAGLTTDQALNDGWQIGLHPDDRERVVSIWQAAIETGQTFQLEYRFQTSERIVWVYGQAVPERDAAGQVVGYVGTITDISDRKQAEAAQQQNEAHQNALISAIPDLILRVNRSGIVQECVATPNFPILGNRDSLRGQHLADILPSLLATERIAAIEAAIDTRQLQVFEQDLSVQGQDQIEEIRVVPYGSDEVLLLVRDMSDRARIERELQESERNSRAILSAIPDLMVRLGGDGTYLGVISQPRSFDAVPPDTYHIGQSITDILPADLAARHLHHTRRALETGELQMYEQQVMVGDRLQYEEVRIVKSGENDVLLMVRDITNRKQAEAALQNSERTNRIIIDTMPDLLIQMNRDGNYTRIGGGSTVNVKYPKTTPDQPDIYTVLPPELATQRLHYAHQALDTGTVQLYEQTIDIDSQLHHEEVRVAPLDDHNVLVIIRDITDRKQADAERLAAEQVRQELGLLETILDVVLAGYWDWNLVDNIAYISPGFKRMFGYEDHELSNQPDIWQNIVVQEDLPEILNRLDHHIRTHGQQPFYNEVRYHHKDGGIVWVICSGKVIEWSKDGQALRMIGCHVNISDRKQIEAALMDSQAKYQRLVDDIGDSFVVFSHAGTHDPHRDDILTYVSSGFTSVFGSSREAAIGQSWVTIADWVEDDLANAIRRTSQVAEQGFQELDMRFYHPDKGLRTLHVCQHPVLDQNGQLIAIEGIAEDITDRKQAEAQLQRSNEELMQATRLKDEFLANMSHELRTPLNAILGMTEALREQVFGPINPRQMQALETAHSSGTHLLELINDILDVSKIEAGQVELSIAPTEVISLCRSSMAFIHYPAQKKQIQLTLQLPPHVPDLLVDERRIRQVLINLLNNAVKFTPEGGRIVLEVMLNEDRSDTELRDRNWLRLAVRDTGIGIAPEQMDDIFQPFVQIDSALNRQYEGTGLGLALVQRLVALHGGQVTVTSEVGVGSCFRVDLPCVNTSDAPSIQSDAVESIVFPSRSNVRPVSLNAIAPTRVLIAEDNEANIGTLSSYLEARGYDLLLARDGMEAIALVESEQPDVIVMDIQMPGMDGLEAIRHIRQNAAIRQPPIIVLTALAMAGDRERCLAAGADEYLSKPVKLIQLAGTIQTVLRDRPSS